MAAEEDSPDGPGEPNGHNRSFGHSESALKERKYLLLNIPRTNECDIINKELESAISTWGAYIVPLYHSRFRSANDQLGLDPHKNMRRARQT